jgi:hypothetical protein
VPPSTTSKVSEPVVHRLQRTLLLPRTMARALSVGLVALLFTGCGPGQHAQSSLEVPAISAVVANTRAFGLVQLPAKMIDGCRWLSSESMSVVQLILDAAAHHPGDAPTASAGGTVGAAMSADASGTAMPAGTTALSNGSILTSGQSTRAATRIAGLSAADRVRMDAALAAATSPEQRQYIDKAIAAGHSVDEVVRFAGAIRGRMPYWLSTHLSLIDPSTPGDLSYQGWPVDQVNNTTCGSASILMVRAMADPLYDLYLTTGGSTDPAGAEPLDFKARLAAEELRIHEATNEIWPQGLGTSPWGVASGLNRYTVATGTQYAWVPIVRTGDADNPALRDAVAAADNGQPVPVLIGDLVPRHYVVLVGHTGNNLLLYDPGSAAVVPVSAQDFLEGDASALGFAHIDAVITPTR